MPKEIISARQTACVLIVFMFGSSVIMGVSSEAAQDSWLSLLLAQVIILPIILIYARIISLFPEKDLFEIIEMLLGKIAGKAVIILIAWYALHLSSLVLRNFSEFVKISVLTATPQLAIILAMTLTVVYMAKSGIETLGKSSVIILPVLILVVVLTSVLAISRMDVENLMPFMEHSLGKIAYGSYKVFTNPYAETVLFLCLAGALKKGESAYKVYTYSSLIATAILLMVIMRNILLLGPALGNAEYFPSYATARVLNVGDFLVHMEGTITMNFILAGIVKITVCLVAVAKGTARLFGIQDYKSIIFPAGLLVAALSTCLYSNIVEMFDFLNVYMIYAIPFQIIIPVVVWILAEVKSRKTMAAKPEGLPSQ